MKCDHCGKEEVNFHYTSNINGNITEKHLCAQCAGELGINGLGLNTGFSGLGGRPLTPPEASFEDIFAELFGMRPARKMFSGYGMMLPTFVIPTVGLIVPGPAAGSVIGTNDENVSSEKKTDFKIEIDDEMKKRREINILREQMHQAAKTEDFEKAAAIRDNIRKLESGANS